MKTALFAAILAFGAAIAVVPAQAASITITTDNNFVIRHDNGRQDSRRHDNGRHLGWYKGQHKGWDRQRVVRRDCEVRTVRYWHHGRLIVERRRDCY